MILIFNYNINIPSYAKIALEKLNNAGFCAYIVGGFLRDSLLDIPSFDIDIATNASTESMRDVFSDEKIIDTGIRFSSISVIIENKEIQITSFRKDGAYTDMRHPDDILLISSLKEDLERRDFSINTLAYSLNDGLIDYTNAINDLENKILRCIKNPKERFKEDPLRILRGIRFSVKLGLTIEENTKKEMQNNAYLLSNISFSRLYNEILKILLLDNANEAFILYYDILSCVFPFLLAMKNFNQNTPYHEYCLLEHTALVIKNSPKDEMLRLAALFHDVGKLYTKTTDTNGNSHYYNHQNVSYNYIKSFLYNKGISHKVVDNAAIIIKSHNDTILVEKPNIKILLNRFNPDLFFKFIDFKIADDSSKLKNKDYNIKKYEKIKLLANKIIADNECFTLSDLDINGNDLEDLSIKKEDRKLILNNILNLVINDKLNNDKNDILNYLKNN